MSRPATLTTPSRRLNRHHRASLDVCPRQHQAVAGNEGRFDNRSENPEQIMTAALV